MLNRWPNKNIWRRTRRKKYYIKQNFDTMYSYKKNLSYIKPSISGGILTIEEEERY